MPDDDPPGPERTVYQPGPPPRREAENPAAPPAQWPVGDPPPAQKSPDEIAWDTPVRKTTAHAMIGATLNHIYRVDRFIAAGGMGAIYEGINVNTDERVAIKIILPQLAEDPAIQALFRNEARALMQLSHPALVQYRLLAREPQLEFFYIVTEFIDGPSLSDVLAQLSVTPEQFQQFAIRLASGLAVAHEMSKIYRDVSPDNVLLPGGKLEGAKIIDFGIAKDLSAVNKTVIGDGFAGKWGTVAPEQFGDPRDVGPWTDIYSLGLLLLAMAMRRMPPMGATLADAIEARKTIPDLSAAPQLYRGVLAKMLEPKIANRFQSMREVITAFENPGRYAETSPAPLSMAVEDIPSREGPVGPPPPPPKMSLWRMANPFQPAREGASAFESSDRSAKAPRARTSMSVEAVPGRETPQLPPGPRPPLLPPTHLPPRPLLIAGGGLLAAAMLFVLVMIPWSSLFAPPKIATNNPVGGPSHAGPAPVPTAEAIRIAMEGAIGNVECSWLDMDQPESVNGTTRIAINGVAQYPDSVESELTDAMRAKGFTVQVETGAVLAVQSGACPVLNAFRAFREPSSKNGRSLKSSSPTYSLEPHQAGWCDPTVTLPQAKPVLTLNTLGAQDFTVLAIDASGGIQQLAVDSADFAQKLHDYEDLGTDLGNGVYQYTPCTDQKTALASPNGVTGLILIKGRGPFKFGLDPNRNDAQQVSPEGLEQIKLSAGPQGWSAQMVWYRISK